MKTVSFMAGICALLVSMGCAGAVPNGIDATQRSEFVRHVAGLVERAYLFPETGKRVAGDLLDRQARGEFDGLDDRVAFAQALTATMRRSSGDLHFSVKAIDADAAGDDAAALLERRRRELESLRGEFNGFTSVSNLEGGVGYLSFSVFRDKGQAEMAAALLLLRNADAIILDLRGHRGGTAEMTNRLLSHFLPPHTHLSDTYDRNGFVSSEYSATGDGSGVQADVPLFVVVDGRTASGAEAAAFHLKHLKRATITGGVTMGAAHSGGTWTIDGFSVFVPNERHVAPATGATWEKIGVAPDVPLAADVVLPKTIELARAAAARYAQARHRDQQQRIARLLQSLDGLAVDGAETQSPLVRDAVAGLSDVDLLDEASVNDLGYMYLGNGRLAAALAVFGANVELHPQSPNAEDSLAEALDGAGRLDDAFAHYAKAVELAAAARSPNLEQHREGLERVRKKLAERH